MNEYERPELHPAPRGLWLTAFLSLLLSFGAGYAWSTFSWAMPYGARATGVVTSYRVFHLPLRPLYFPSVRYDVAGFPYQTRASLPTASPVAVGQAMRVDHDPHAPGRAKLGYEMDV